MLTHTSHYPITSSQMQTLSHLGLPKTHTICLDIETTGLMPSVCAVFMIGTAMICHDELIITQWLADGLTWDDEAAVLQAFTDFLSLQKGTASPLHLLTYNGDRFDLRFLKERFTQCRLSDPLDDPNILTTDLMVKCKPLKKIYNLPNMKLKTLASFMELSEHKADTTPEGRALIRCYHAYIKTKDPESLDLLWLHNKNDLIQTIGILPMYQALVILEGKFQVEKASVSDGSLHLLASSVCSAPSPIDLDASDIHLHVEGSQLSINISIHERGLRYYHTDYKNYVYLPKEDFVIPKSMAAYVPSSDRCRASKENCHTWFLPDESFLGDPSQLTAYARMLSLFLILSR